MSKTVPIAINTIRRDGGTQMRVAINEEAVVAYAERMEFGDVFPEVIVFYDGASHWLADGFHRVAARERLSAMCVAERHPWSFVEAQVISGDRNDAIAFAIKANRNNGLRRTNADKHMAVRAALAHPKMRGMSDRDIASEVGVSHEMVRSCRQVSTVDTSSSVKNHKAINTPTDKRMGADGKFYPPKQQTRKSVSSAKEEIANRAAARKAATQTNKPQAPSGRPVENSDAARVIVEMGQSTRVARHVCPTCSGKGYIE